jgi:hypothetical protein
VAGTRYFIQAVHHEGGGGDDLSATFKLLADPDPADDTATAFNSNVIGHMESPVVNTPILSVTLASNKVTIAWTPAGGHLQSATALLGSATQWITGSTTNPAIITVQPGQAQFYRVATP